MTTLSNKALAFVICLKASSDYETEYTLLFYLIWFSHICIFIYYLHLMQGNKRQD